MREKYWTCGDGSPPTSCSCPPPSSVEDNPIACTDPSDGKAYYFKRCTCADGATASLKLTNANRPKPCPSGGGNALCSCPAGATDVGAACIQSGTERMVDRFCTCNGKEI